MFKPKSEQCTAGVTPERSPHNQPFVQTESELIEARLEALANGMIKLTNLYTSFQVEVRRKAQLEETRGGD